MSIPQEDWLHLAKRLPVGSTTRIYYKRDTRPNLVIGNSPTKFWCYCQKRKAGGVVEKDHVRITGVVAPSTSTQLDMPRDSVPLLSLDEFSRDAVLRLLALKNMDQMYLPELYFSDQRKRMLLNTGQGWLGRDTTGASPQKWLAYSGTLSLGKQEGEGPTNAVVVEDPFSYYKVRWALRDDPSWSVYCALGTVIRPALALIMTEHPKVVMFFDGDDAGVTGAKREAKKLRGLGVQAIARPAPTGFDPKDLTIEVIRRFLLGT
uniref:DNA primase n=4 Tax=unclassified bacterial viruses TaxID=12333 RepID=A0AAU6W0N6_9VIRU